MASETDASGGQPTTSTTDSGTQSGDEDLEPGRLLPGQIPHGSRTIQDLPLCDRILCVAATGLAVLQMSLEADAVRILLHRADWIGPIFFWIWVVIAGILVCRHLAVFWMYAKYSVPSFIALCLLAPRLFNFGVFNSVPLIATFSTAAPPTGIFLQQAISRLIE